MKNKEYFKEQIFEIACNYQQIAVSKKTHSPCACWSIGCGDCELNKQQTHCGDMFKMWLKQEHVEPALNDVERRYLEAFLRPFKNRINYIVKLGSGNEHTFLRIFVKSYDNSGNLEDFSLPFFNGLKMYTGMKPGKEYTLEELGLFAEEEKDCEE